MSDVTGRHDLIERGHTQQPHPLELTVKLGGRLAWTNPPQQRYLRCSLCPLSMVEALVLYLVSMFACSEWVGANQTGPTLMKLTTICEVSHVINYTRPSPPLFFSGGIERKAWERG